MVKVGGGLHGVPDGLEPLRVVIPRFETRNISQSLPLSGAENFLMLHFMSSLQLSGHNAQVFIHGLTGLGSSTYFELQAASHGAEAEYLFCAADGSPRQAWWDSTDKVLALTICSDKNLLSLVQYRVRIRIENPVYEQRSPPVSISAQSSSFVILSTPMIKPGTTLYGVEKGADPLEI
eukprot:2181280-Rhodomonas_salina.1